jgi:hypothetical protein
MGDSLTKNQGLDRGECLKGESKSPSPFCEDMTDKTFNEIFRKQKVENSSHLPSADLLIKQLSDAKSEAPNGLVCLAPKHEERGNTEVVTDEYGKMFEVKDNRGHTFTKTPDGKWVDRSENDKEHKHDNVVKNVKVDDKGNITYDDNNNAKMHYQQNSDGSHSVTNEFGKTSYDKDGNCIEAPAGAGHSRKFHYTNGQLDQIEGNLGHWDRVTKNGQVSWVNKNSGAVWNGDFKLQSDGELEYSGRNGANWSFTVWGKDIDQTLPRSK